MSSQEIFKRRINGKLPVLVDFYDPQNTNCRTMQAILKIVAYRLETKIRIHRVNIHNRTNREVIQEYLPQSSPKFMFFYEGQLKWNASGIFSSRQLIFIIEQIIQSNPLLEEG